MQTNQEPQQELSPELKLEKLLAAIDTNKISARDTKALLTLKQDEIKYESDPEHNGLNMSDLARACGHSVANNTGMIDKLEKLGLTKRAFFKKDRRSITVMLTTNGRNTITEIPATL